MELSSPSVLHFTDFRTFLVAHAQERRSSNPAWSYAFYANGNLATATLPQGAELRLKRENYDLIVTMPGSQTMYGPSLELYETGILKSCSICNGAVRAQGKVVMVKGPIRLSPEGTLLHGNLAAQTELLIQGKAYTVDGDLDFYPNGIVKEAHFGVLESDSDCSLTVNGKLVKFNPLSPVEFYEDGSVKEGTLFEKMDIQWYDGQSRPTLGTVVFDRSGRVLKTKIE